MTPRERVRQLTESKTITKGSVSVHPLDIEDAIRAAVKEERDACAALEHEFARTTCNDYYAGYMTAIEDYAEAIRARDKCT